MKKEARHVKGILDGILSKLETGKRKGNAVSEAWMKAAGEETRAHARPVNIKNGVLTVVVQDSVWLYKLLLEKRKLLERFNENYPGRKKAADMRFRVGASEFS